MKTRLFGTVLFLILLLLMPFMGFAQALPTSPLLGTKSLLGVLVNFAYDPNHKPVSAAQLQTVLNQVGAYYKEASYGQFQFSRIDVSDWVTVDAPSGTCPTIEIGAQLPALLLAKGIDVNLYDRVSIHFYGNTTCTFGGVGGPKYVYNHKLIEFRTAAHELGHSFALGHAGGLDCEDATRTNCVEKTYWDHWDIMGAGSYSHFNARAKEYLGWLRNDSSLTTIREVTQSGVYKMGPLASSGSLPRALKIRKGIRQIGNYMAEEWIYLEFRQTMGFDTGVDGALVRWVNNGGGAHYSALVDMTPNSQASDLDDAPLPVGASYYEPTSGVNIRLISLVANQEMTVEVTFQNSMTPPLVQNESLATPINTPILINALSNDSDADGQVLSLLGTVRPDSLSAMAVGNAFVAGSTSRTAGDVYLTSDQKLNFVPFSTFSGSAEIFYVVSDGIFLKVGKATVNVGGTVTTTPTKPGKGGGGGGGGKGK